MTRSEKEKMLAGELYHAGAPELQADAAKAKAWMLRYNASMAASTSDRRALLLELLGAVGDGAVVRPPFFCDYGYNIRLGSDVFLNFNCIILDVVPLDELAVWLPRRPSVAITAGASSGTLTSGLTETVLSGGTTTGTIISIWPSSLWWRSWPRWWDHWPAT